MRIIITFLAIVTFSFGYSQYTEIANVNVQRFTGEDAQGFDINTNVFEASLLVGFPLSGDSDKNTIFFRPSYHQRILENSPDTRLYKPEFIAGLSHNINDTWNYRVFGLVRLASDFEMIDSQYYQYGGGALFTYKKSDNLSYKFGAYARKQPEGVLAFPFLGLDYSFGNDKWFLNVLLPQYANLRYQLKADKLYTGLRLSFVTEQYQFSNFLRNYAELTQFQSELYLEYYLTDGLVIFGKASPLNYQKYELFDNDDNLINGSIAEVENVFSFQFGLAYRIKK